MALLYLTISLAASFLVLHMSTLQLERPKSSPRKAGTVLVTFLILSNIINLVELPSSLLVELLTRFTVVFLCVLFIYKLKLVNVVIVSSSFVFVGLLVSSSFNVVMGVLKNA